MEYRSLSVILYYIYMYLLFRSQKTNFIKIIIISLDIEIAREKSIKFVGIIYFSLTPKLVILHGHTLLTPKSMIIKVRSRHNSLE